MGKGNETLMDLDEEEVSHVLETEQTNKTNHTNNEQTNQEPGFVVESASDPAQLLNDFKK